MFFLFCGFFFFLRGGRPPLSTLPTYTTFFRSTLFGTGDPRLMASGISLALTTTVEGLIVAIPLTIIHSVLQSRSRSLIQILEEQAAGIIARLAESGGNAGSR